MARNPNPPPGGPWEYHENQRHVYLASKREVTAIPPRPFIPRDRHVGRLVSRRQPPEGMFICPITGAWRHYPPPRIEKSALMRSVWGCVIMILGIVTWGITGAEWAFLTVAAGCFLMSRTVVVEVLHWSRDNVADVMRKFVEAERHHRAIRTIRDGVYRGGDDLRDFAYRGPAESRPMQPGQMIDPRPEGSMMLPPVVVLGVDVPTHDDVVEAMKAINEGGDLFEVWIVSKTRLSFDEWMDATIPEIEG